MARPVARPRRRHEAHDDAAVGARSAQREGAAVEVEDHAPRRRHPGESGRRRARERPLARYGTALRAAGATIRQAQPAGECRQPRRDIVVREQPHEPHVPGEIVRHGTEHGGDDAEEAAPFRWLS